MAGGRIQCVIPSIRLCAHCKTLHYGTESVLCCYVLFVVGLWDCRISPVLSAVRPPNWLILLVFSNPVVAFWLRCLKGEDLDFGPKVDRCIPPPDIALALILFSTTGAPQYLTLGAGQQLI